MNKVENKKKMVVVESAKLFYFNGYKNTGLNEILKVCKIPKGSFYYYFKTKEELLIHVIDYHTNNLIKHFDTTVNDLSIFKFKTFFYQYLNSVETNNFYGGSPLGNIAIELSDINENIRTKVSQSFRKLEMKFSFFLTMMKNTNSNYSNIAPELYANTLMYLLEGVMLKTKIDKTDHAKDNFLKIFDMLFK